MKKIISVLVALILVIGCTALTATAAPSPAVEDVVTIIGVKDNTGNKAGLNLVKLDDMVEELKPSSTQEAVIGQYGVKVEGTPKYPLTVEAEIVGVKTTSTVYVLAQKSDGTVKKIEATVTKTGKIEFEIEEEFVNLSVVTDKQTATNIGVSDKTGDSVNTVVMSVLFLAVAVAVISAKKVNA